MKTRFKFRFYPTKIQENELSRVFGSCRFVYNRFLRERTDAWHDRQERVDYCKTSAMLTGLKKTEEFKWLNEVSCAPTQQALRHLNTAFLNFWNKTAKYPTFKKKNGKQAAEYTVSAFKYEPVNRNLKVSGLGRLDVHWSREFKSQPTTATITKSPSGRYFVTLCLDEDCQPLPKTGRSVGIDFGVRTLATLSNGEKVSNPRHLARKTKRLVVLQRRLSRKAKGSNRRKMMTVKIAKVHESISDARKDYINKFTTDIVRRFDTICIEDLNIRGMVANHKVARAISDAGLSMTRAQLEYKCVRYGKELRLVDRFYPSSKRCHKCGHILESLPLSVRSWTCPACWTIHDRDVNAAVNIELAGGQPVCGRGGGVRRRRASAPRRSLPRSVHQSPNLV